MLSSERRTVLTWHNGRVVEESENAARFCSEESLLLRALEKGTEVNVIGLTEFLTRLSLSVQQTLLDYRVMQGGKTNDVGELGFGDKALRFGAHKFLL